jgi:nucleoside-diphosphate-sugar epimerase
MKKIAVTGATGFVGRNLVPRLRAKGYEVVAFSRQEKNGYISWDISAGILTNAPPIDAVVHCAGDVDDWARYPLLYRVNVVGTENVLNSFPNAGRFIYVSSASVYDPFRSTMQLTEDSSCGNFLNAYSRSKREAEIKVENAKQTIRVILRPHAVYGPGDTTVLPRLLKARRFGHFLVLGDGKNRISVTHVENLCEAIIDSLEKPLKSGCSIFNIADTSQDVVDVLVNELRDALGIREPVLHIPKQFAYFIATVSEFAYRIFAAKKPPLITRYAVAQMAYGHALDISKAVRELGYSPRWDYREGFAKMKI